MAKEPAEQSDKGIKSLQSLKPVPALRRLNGFGCPPHGFQLAAVFANVWSSFFFFSLHVMALYGWLQYVFIATFSAAVLVHVIFFLVATAIDPADPNVRAKSKNAVLPTFDRSKHRHVIENLTCAICEVKVGLKSKHCSACNKCVWNFDHHCPWLNNCVGGANYRFFIVTVVSADIGLVLLFGLAIAQLVTYFSDENDGQFLRPYYERLNSRSNNEIAAAAAVTTLPPVFGGNFTNSYIPTTTLPPPVFTLVGASVPNFVWLIFVCIDILLAAIGIGLLSHLLVFHCYLASHHLSTYDYITLSQQPTTNVDDSVSVAEEVQPCSGRTDLINEVSGNNTANINGASFHHSSSAHVRPSAPSTEQKYNQQLPNQTTNFGCSALGSKEKRSSKVDVLNKPSDHDSISTLSARVLTADSGRYTGVENGANPPNSHRGGLLLAPIHPPAIGPPMSSRSPRQRRRRSRLNKNLPNDNGGLDGLPYDADYHQQVADMRATFPGGMNGIIPGIDDRHFDGRQTTGLPREDSDGASSPPVGVSPLPLPPPSPTPLVTATTNYNAASSVWRTTDRSTLETDSRMLGDLNNNKFGLPPLGIARLQLPLTTTTNFAIGTNPFLGASIESNFSQYSLRSVPNHGANDGNLFASKFSNNFQLQQQNYLSNSNSFSKQSGFIQPPQIMANGPEQAHSEYLVPRLSLSHSSFA